MINLVDNEYYELKAEISGSWLYLHLNYKIEKFTKTVYKIMLEQWVEILDNLKDSGVTEVRSIIPNDEEKTKKFQLMLGMEEYLMYEPLTVYRRVL